jgi:hypothetical protein
MGKPAMVVAFRDSGESFSLQGGSLVAGFFGKTWFYERLESHSHAAASRKLAALWNGKDSQIQR